MGPPAISILALATFFLGLYIGHRWGGHDARVEASDQKRRFRRLRRFAEPYIEAHAEEQYWRVERNESGVIIDIRDPPIHCGTSVLIAHKLLEDHRRRKSLH